MASGMGGSPEEESVQRRADGQDPARGRQEPGGDPAVLPVNSPAVRSRLCVTSLRQKRPLRRKALFVVCFAIGPDGLQAKQFEHQTPASHQDSEQLNRFLGMSSIHPLFDTRCVCHQTLPLSILAHQGSDAAEMPVSAPDQPNKLRDSDSVHLPKSPATIVSSAMEWDEW